MACPMHNAEKLCQIQVDHGATYLSRTCAVYPRQTYTFDHRDETTLALSCPEAARIILTDPNVWGSTDVGSDSLTWDDEDKTQRPLRTYFWPIRDFTVTLLRNRTYPLWQRMFLLGTFCRRLEAVQQGEVEGGFSALEAGFSKAIVAGSLRESIETLPANHALQLDMVFQLLNLPMTDARSHRFEECLSAFSDGIGQGPDATFEGQTAQYALAYERYYAPFFVKHPHMLENLLVNEVFKRIFPFGPSLFDPEGTPEPATQYALLATQFALIKGLLIGAAGSHKEAFSVEHVVHTVQVAVKYFDHNANFLPWSLALLTTKGLDNAHGLTMLLRN